MSSESSSSDDSSTNSSSNSSASSDAESVVEEEVTSTVREQEPSASTIVPSTLAKAFRLRKSHVPIYTGGKVLYSQNATQEPFLVLPIQGNVVLVSAQDGVPIAFVRDTDTEEDDDEGADTEAITAYALHHHALVCCSQNGLLRKYTIQDAGDDKKKKIHLVQTHQSGHSLPVTLIEFHASGVFLATGSVDGTCRIWDVRGASHVTHVFRPYANDGGGSGRHSVTAISWLQDLTRLLIAVGRDDGTIAIHDLRQTDQVVALLSDHMGAVTHIQWTHDQQRLISGGRDSVMNVWRVQEGDGTSKQSRKKKRAQQLSQEAYVRVHTVPTYESLEGMVIFPFQNARRHTVVATAGSNGVLRLWKLDRDRLEPLAEQPASVAFGPERGGYTDLSYVESLDPASDVPEEGLVVADAEHNITFLSVLDQQPLTTRKTIVGHNDDILDLQVISSPDTNAMEELVVVTNSAQVRLFDPSSFACSMLDGHTATVLCIDASPCGRYLVTCGKDKTARVWDRVARRCLAVAVGHTEAVGGVAFSRKAGRFDCGGAFLTTVSADRTLKLWKFPNRFEKDEPLSLVAVQSARAHDKDINVVSVAPNDSLIATGSQDKTIKLWAPTDLSLRATLKGHRRGVWDCRFSPTDRILASGSVDKTIKLWSLSDFSCLRTLQGHVASVLRVRFLPTGLQLVSAGGDGLVKVWTLRTNECVTTLDGHIDKVWALDLNGHQIVSGGSDSRLNVWEDMTKEVDEARHAQQEASVLVDQKLANHLRRKEYSEALAIALENDKPYHALKILTAIVEENSTSTNKCEEEIKVHVRSWSDEKLVRILRYCREWNTRARTCHVALLVMKVISSTIPVHRLTDTDGVSEVIAGMVPYAERHFERLDRLRADSYLLDFILASMGVLDEELEPAAADVDMTAAEEPIPIEESSEGEESDVMTIGESDDDEH